MSSGIRRKAKARRIDYAFLFMRADGEQLARITALIETGALRPILDRTYPFSDLNDAFAYIESGRSRGKVVVTVREDG